jgi:hypothetical protein
MPGADVRKAPSSLQISAGARLGVKRLLGVACALASTLVGAHSGNALESRTKAGASVVKPGLSALRAADRAALALHWAPIHYQDVDQRGAHSLGGRADYITRYDFDGDLDARNNWDRASSGAYPLTAHVYYSVVETGTHWFIVYMFFHPRDWSNTFFDTEHENDTEGLLVTIARDASTYGNIRSAVTVAHNDFYSYLPTGSDWRRGAESVDGTLSLVSYDGSLHPVTAQQAQGHGLKARPYYDIHGDGVVYYPSLTTAEEPRHPNDRNVSYRLVDIFEPGGLFDNRDNPALFASAGSFAGNSSGACGRGVFSCRANAAHAPWAWDDNDDRQPRGALANDPARLVKSYFSIPEPLSLSYSFNPYR